MEIKEFLGKTFIKVAKSDDGYEIIFVDDKGNKFRMYHDQSCCENVNIEDIDGKLENLVGSPILQAEESRNWEDKLGKDVEECDSFTWTFYKLATVKGYVTIRWFGTSNGCYSETCEIEEIK